MNTEPRRPFFDPEAVTKAVIAIHAANKDPNRQRLFAIRVTGAAARLAGVLTDIPGASRTVYDVQVRYHQASSMAAAGKRISKAVSREMAVELAQNARRVTRTEMMSCYGEAALEEQPIVYGLGLTAAVATDRTRRGGDIIIAALTTEWRTSLVEATFARGSWQRHEQDAVCQILALNLMLWSMGLPQIEIFEDRLPGELYCLEKQYGLDQNHNYLPERPFTLRPTKADVWAITIGKAELEGGPLLTPAGALVHMPPSVEHTMGRQVCMICTSGHPFTESHRSMADEARRRNLFPIFAIESTAHPDKGGMPIEEASERMNHFLGREFVLLTQGLGFYAEKAAAYPDMVFAIGMDVARRLVDTSHERCQRDLAQLRENGAKFLVFPRYNGDTLETMADLSIPEGFADLFESAGMVPPPISSTKVRIALGIEVGTPKTT